MVLLDGESECVEEGEHAIFFALDGFFFLCCFLEAFTSLSPECVEVDDDAEYEYAGEDLEWVEGFL